MIGHVRSSPSSSTSTTSACAISSLSTDGAPAWRLVRLGLQNEAGDTDSVLEDVYGLWREGLAPMLLDGSSAPVHEAN